MQQKVIIEMADSAPRFTRAAWAKVFRSIGWQATEWWPEQISAHDVFNQVDKPTLFIGTTYNFNRPLIKLAKAHPEMKIALFGSAYGDLTNSIDSKKYPIVKISDEEKKVLGDLRKEIGKPDLVFIHITDKYLMPCMGKWTTELGIPVTGILNGGDLFTYYNAEPDAKYDCDIGYVGGRWGYKSRTLDKYLGRLCDENNFNIKIFGNGWDKPQALGTIDIGEDAKVFASSHICPNISEEHSENYGFDVVERCFKVPLAGGFLISDYVNELEDIFPENTCPMFKNYTEFVKLIEYYLENESERIYLFKLQQSHIINNHTYHHRMSKLLSLLDFNKESKLIMNSYLNILSNT